MQPEFYWTTFDVSASLPAGWQREIKVVGNEADFREYKVTPVLSREAPDVTHVTRGRVHADHVRDRLPWLQKAYRNEFLSLANRVCQEDVVAALDDRYGIVLNAQKGTHMRFECHVDSNPLTGLLFCTDHAAGGELVVARDPAAVGTTAVETSCTAIRPQAGYVVYFDARRYPHYARALTADDDIRVVAVMNFYTQSCPESTRPPELNRHLYGDRNNHKR